MISSIFFDFDGTLCDTQTDIIEAYIKTFSEANISIEAKDLHIGPTLTECLKLAKPDITDEELSYCVGRFPYFYDNGNFPNSVAYAGVLAMLLELKKRGLSIFIATNKRLKPLKLILEKLQMESLFVGLYGSDMLMPERKLTKSDMLDLALKEHSIAPESALMVGDTAGDIRAGQANNMQTLAVRWGYAKAGELEANNPDFWANRAEDIIELC